MVNSEDNGCNLCKTEEEEWYHDLNDVFFDGFMFLYFIILTMSYNDFEKKM